MKIDRLALIWCPISDIETAREIATKMLEEKLAACANIIPQIESLFVWNGQVQSEKEAAILFKTDGDVLPASVERLAQLHPYETPAIAGWMADVTPPATLSWLNAALIGGMQNAG